MTARWGEPVRRAAAPVMVSSPSVSTDDLTRLLERREARPVDDVAEPSSESPVATLLARRNARAALPAEPQNEGVEDQDISPVDAFLSRRAESRHQPTGDDPVDAMSVARLIAAREARATARPAPPADESVSEPDTASPPLDALLARRAARAAEPPEPPAERDHLPVSASPSLDALLSRRDNRTRPPASLEETP